MTMSIRESRFSPCAPELDNAYKKQKHEHVILVGQTSFKFNTASKRFAIKKYRRSVFSLQPEMHMYHNNESWCGDMSAPIIQTVN